MFRLCLPVLLLLCATACRSNLPQAVPAADPPVTVISAPPADWAVLQGRRVRIGVPLTISGNHRLARDRELVASFDGRLFAPTDQALPGADAQRLAAANRARQLQVRLPGDATADTARWRSGGVLEAAIGTIEVLGDVVRLHADALDVRPAPRPPAPAPGGDVRVASLNLENLFNGDGAGGGFPTARGARTREEYERQLARLVATLRALDPDIAALMELENDGYAATSSVAQLVAALRAAQPGADWRFVWSETGPGGDDIRVGLIYRADRVSTDSGPAELRTAPLGVRSRVPLAQRFRAGAGPAFDVVAVHLKSKGCSEATGADADQGDGQACWNATRLESVRLLHAWRAAAIRPGGVPTLLLGDFNAYRMEDPIRHLVEAGWTDALATAADRPYSFVFDAQAGRLDHALLSPGLRSRLVAAAEWHANADEADPGEDVTGPWRSSDHDPLLLGFRLRSP